MYRDRENNFLDEQQKISNVKARQVLDSRGNPTVEAEVWTRGGCYGRAMVPSGASTGTHEALELRDGDRKVYSGFGVQKAVNNINTIISERLYDINCTEQMKIDHAMIDLDGTLKNAS